MFRRLFLSGAMPAAAAALVSKGHSATCSYQQTAHMIRRVVRLPEESYFTYPHSNGFLNGNTCIIAETRPDYNVAYVGFDLASQQSFPITTLHHPRLYYALASNGLMAVPMNDGVTIVDVGKRSSRKLVTWPDWRVLGDCDISPDGKYALISRFDMSDPKSSRIDMIDTSTGEVTPVFAARWPLDHAHFSPYDPSWIVFCDGSPHARRRIWVWHPYHAPAGRPVFSQVRPDGTSFDLGHERAMFHKPAILVVAYADSSAEPRGLYEVDFDGRARLVSESNRDCHCNISRDGRWAVASTLGPATLGQGALDLCERSPADWTRSETGFVISDVCIVNMATGNRQFLFRATNAVDHGASKQPYEVQPAISPDGQWVVLKDAREKRVLALEIDTKSLRL